MSSTMSPRKATKTADEKRTKPVSLKTTPPSDQAWRDAAHAARLTVNEWAIRHLDRAAARELKAAQKK